MMLLLTAKLATTMTSGICYGWERPSSSGYVVVVVRNDGCYSWGSLTAVSFIYPTQRDFGFASIFGFSMILQQTWEVVLRLVLPLK